MALTSQPIAKVSSKYNQTIKYKISSTQVNAPNSQKVKW